MLPRKLSRAASPGEFEVSQCEARITITYHQKNRPRRAVGCGGWWCSQQCYCWFQCTIKSVSVCLYGRISYLPLDWSERWFWRKQSRPYSSVPSPPMTQCPRSRPCPAMRHILLMSPHPPRGTGLSERWASHGGAQRASH